MVVSFLCFQIVKFRTAIGAEFLFACKEENTKKFSAERASLREKSDNDPRQQKYETEFQQRMQPIATALQSALCQQDDADVQKHRADPISDFLLF